MPDRPVRFDYRPGERLRNTRQKRDREDVRASRDQHAPQLRQRGGQVRDVFEGFWKLAQRQTPNQDTSSERGLPNERH